MREIDLDDSHYSAHSLRQTFATISHRPGAAREQIRQIRGDSDSQTAEQYIQDDDQEDFQKNFRNIVKCKFM